MKIYTVSFFGHREIENASEVEQRLDRILHDLIVQKEYRQYRTKIVRQMRSRIFRQSA